jgi:hypothetical protein
LGKTGIALRPEMRFDAYKIYCDERDTTRSSRSIRPCSVRSCLILLSGRWSPIMNRSGSVLPHWIGAEEVRQVIEESYPPARVIAGLRKTGFATLRLFERNGVFEDSRTLEAFNQSGLLG